MSLLCKPRKLTRSTVAQIAKLVDFMSTNPLFAIGEFTGPLGPQKVEAQWVQLKNMLDECGPAKSVDQWKHTWRDLKKKARYEAAQVRLAQQATGNTVSVPVLSEKTQKILGVIGNESAYGIAVESETLAATSSPSSVCHLPSQYLSEDIVIEMEDVSPPALPSTSSTPARLPQSRASPSPRPQRRERASCSQSGRAGRVAAQPSSQLFIAAQKETNKILKELAQKIIEKEEMAGQRNLMWMRMKRRTAGRTHGPKFHFP